MARCEQAVRAGFTRAIHALFHEANRSGRISGHTARASGVTLFARTMGGARIKRTRSSSKHGCGRTRGDHRYVQWPVGRPPAELDRGHARARLRIRHAPGDAVLVFHPMSAELSRKLARYFGYGWSQCSRSSAGRATSSVALASAEALIAGVNSLAAGRASGGASPVKVVIGPLPCTVRWSAADQRPIDEVRDCDDDTPALRTFTSGSTPQPKDAQPGHSAQYKARASLALTPGTWMCRCDRCSCQSGLGRDQSDSGCRPPPSRCVCAPPIFAQIQAHQVTTSVASPAFFECLVRHGAPAGLTLPR